MADISASTYKVLLLGDSSVGKTCLLMRFTDNTYSEVHLATIGLDYRAFIVNKLLLTFHILL